jgi:TPR repeat protein
MGQPKANAESLKKAAEKGDPKAQLNYGKSLTDSSREEAGKWIQKAADQGLGEAWYWLGFAGLGSKNELYYYEKAAELKYKDAFDHLFDALIFRAGSSSDINKAKKYADLARKFRIDLGFGGHESLQTIDRCFAAGPLKIPDTDQPSENEKKKLLQELSE